MCMGGCGVHVCVVCVRVCGWTHVRIVCVCAYIANVVHVGGVGVHTSVRCVLGWV